MKYKHFLSVALVLCMLQIIAIPAVNAESNKVDISVVSETDADKAVCFLEGLVIDTNFKSAEHITRAQFTSLLVNLAYKNSVATFKNTVFEDVSEENEFYNEINHAYDLGVVSGNKLFRPDDYISFVEAMTMALRVLGYGYVAENNGGYPSGYMKWASDLGLRNGIYRANNESLNGSDVLLLLYNMLDIDFMTRDFRGDGVSYSKKVGSNILTDKYDLKGVDGIVTSTIYSDLSGASTVNDDNIIKINGRRLKYSGDSFDLLGMRVIAYVNKDDEVVIICPVSNQILKADEVESFSNSTLKIKNGKITKNVKLDSSFCFIYNGVAYNAYTATDFTNFEGDIKLVDNNADGKYDVVFVYDVEYMKVSQIDKINKKLYGKAVSRDNISFDEFSHIRFYNSGVEINPIDIKVDDILAIMISKDGKVGKVEVIKNEVYGTLTEIADEYITIDGIKYNKSAHLIKYYSLIPGTTGTFNIGIRNDVIMINTETSGEYRYGYLVDVGKDPNTDIYSLKIFTENEEFEVYECLEKLNLNGRSIKTYDLWDTNAYPLTDTANVAQRQLIKYKLTDGSISAIDTVSDAVSEKALDQANDNNKDSLLRYFNQIEAQYYTTGNIYTFLKFNVDSQTKIFSVPDPLTTDFVEEDFTVKSLSSFKKDSKYTVDAYDLNENGVASVVIVYEQGSSGLSESTDFGIIDTITEVYHEDLGACKKLMIWRFKECVAYYIEEDKISLLTKESGNKLTTGDVVRIYSKNSIIRDMDVIFDVDNMELTSSGSAINGGNEEKTNSSRAFTFSSLYKATDKYFIVTRTKTDGNWDYGLDNLRYIPMYNDAAVIVVEDEKVKKIYSDEFLDYCSASYDADELLIVQGYWGTSLIVVYR